ncbi:MAG TPA: dTDP-4-dehydrorhamnose 3,5-epimerase [Deltaproteobacteria bacterium]|nr:MAG: dTDP-4-dehydrorhamnose 3,5-epimerase [Deltaproteobacteria bacterium GWA2_55_82]OGQ62024.1 MAG: dTDP-4-dehydrorhamnose 3,5-epimerase [Deltaproteobacteria bacterium RIFCSPLOWO2_02_FULL_55_12]OIJ74120.1 MAG: dTDP-4-dehydrorhamnose 3,5-epimerase [Deltaproteobacteria bacterium GWC2_55_46]HBG46734.1 dTDP-4-dehydrorhamnose 3,5-epimerase [Deltaproteobacteria bacterium]HCY11257.1 dTDP-4-dehydrorhamnose 3,5-epimerase [Deltaproteobacteria bacterium]
MFKEGKIEGIVVKELKRYADERGWLMELFRTDEVEREYHPVMTYVSLTRPGIARGPHEHIDQADYFCFAGPSDFKVFLWDNRPESPTYRHKMTFIAGESNPAVVIVPKNVVHAYKNVGESEGLVINCPNRLFKGEGKREPVDEVRHESDSASLYRLD